MHLVSQVDQTVRIGDSDVDFVAGEQIVTEHSHKYDLTQFEEMAREAGFSRFQLHDFKDPGNLYFEVHETKQEVYVVTAVDETAWPDGVGRIRYGINQSKRDEYADDAAFRAAFLEALKAYESLRQQVDAGDGGRADVALGDGDRQTGARPKLRVVRSDD